MSKNLPDGTRSPTNLFEAAAWHYSVKVICGWCGHIAVFDPHAIWWLFERRRWDDRLPLAATRFACLQCRRTWQKEAKGASRIKLVREEPTTQSLPLPPENEWKRAISRFRS